MIISAFYAHCDKIFPEVGDTVSKGDKIAEIGYNGYVVPRGVSGSHLHFACYYGEHDRPITSAETENKNYAFDSRLLRQAHYYLTDDLLEGEHKVKVTSHFADPRYGGATNQGSKLHFGWDVISNNRAQKGEPSNGVGIMHNRSNPSIVTGKIFHKGYGWVLITRPI